MIKADGTTTTATEEIVEAKSEETIKPSNDVEQTNDEFAYTKHTSQAQANKTKQIKIEYPIPLKKQIIISSSTTLISSIPIMVKLLNKQKNPKCKPVTYSDVADFMIYKIPDLVQILKRKFYGNWMERHGTKVEILAFLATLTPTIRNIILQHKTKGGIVELDSELASHLMVVASQILIPLVINNDKVQAVFTRVIFPGIKNFIISNMINSPNPLIREVASAIPLAFLLGDKARYVYDSTVNQNKPVDGTTEAVFNNVRDPMPKNKTFFDKIIDAASDALENSSKRKYNQPNYYYNNSNYGSYYSGGYGNGSSSPWSPHRHM